MWISLLSLTLFPATLKRSAGGLIWPTEAEVERSSLGISNSHTFCRSLSFLFCHRKGASDDEGRLRRTPSPTRPLSPKTDKRPIFRTLSDKQDLLAERLPVQITIQRVDEGAEDEFRRHTLIKTALVCKHESPGSAPFCQVNVAIELVVHHIDIMSHFYTQVGAI